MNILIQSRRGVHKARTPQMHLRLHLQVRFEEHEADSLLRILMASFTAVNFQTCIIQSRGLCC